VKAFRTVSGVVAVLDRADVDTDQIIPKQFLKRIERSGYGEFLFFDWMKDPAFELRQPAVQGATILLTGRNFGCGSSREHAAWALEDAGFRAILAPSFGDIFHTNALKTGLVPVELDEPVLAEIHGLLRDDPELTVDLEACEVRHSGGFTVGFDFDPFAREMLLEGLDEVALTLRREEAIARFERAHPAGFDTRALAAGG
jgi:3-isopropylmalate/(R)-2-methylmalate dehydratase small subunit